MIDYWMITGIQDPDVRATTITLYLDVPKFLQALKLPNSSTIYVLLLDRKGHVHWHTSGAYTADHAAQLTQAVAGLLPVDGYTV
jgi:hypothetical protein